MQEWTNVCKRNKALFSNDEKKCLGKWETKQKRKKIIYCCMESPVADD